MHTLKNTQLPLFLLILFVAFSCGQKPQEAEVVEVEVAEEITFPERGKDMTIYEVNIRQYTPEGTLNAFAEHLPRLANMGVDMLWLMPVQPIGVKNRKGELGSYYSIQDYTEVNPEFGTVEDFKNMVSKAHELGMVVILDWVPNHTAWDHPWITEFNDYYTKDEDGNIIPPVPDWSDVADLNYDNEEMRGKMIEEMRFWVTETDLDGFRCDVASEVPLDFWEVAIPELNKEKDLFWLGETDKATYHPIFHMTYSWPLHARMNEVAEGKIDVNELVAQLGKDQADFIPEAYRMTFTSNHDENSWNGTEFERMGDGYPAFAVFSYTVQGMPLIYSGQEAGLDRRLEFFKKDNIDWSELPYEQFYKDLNTLKDENPALWHGTYGGTFERVQNDNMENTLVYKRVKGDNEVLVVLNLSSEEQEVGVNASGNYTNYFGKSSEELNNPTFTLQPWEYRVYTN